MRYDVVVIGSGPGGEGAAMTAAKAGKTVAVIDRYAEVGGGCVHWGTIPSKVLRHAVGEYVDFRRNPLFQPALEHLEINYPQLLDAARGVIEKQTSMRRRFYERNNDRFVDGHASFVDAHSVEATNDDGAVELVKGDQFAVVRARPSFDEILKRDTIPDWIG